MWESRILDLTWLFRCRLVTRKFVYSFMISIISNIYIYIYSGFVVDHESCSSHFTLCSMFLADALRLIWTVVSLVFTCRVREGQVQKQFCSEPSKKSLSPSKPSDTRNCWTRLTSAMTRAASAKARQGTTGIGCSAKYCSIARLFEKSATQELGECFAANAC